ncbi:NAD-dependent succinate-semialdehyde dehydrogenase [Halocynthiibacter sp. C4]|uniref:NAD-dependent succinate-semialdehyde dehydrogenase n=1 Tax=Halocynthiibacter sp. C4 TaxID=2992758 RepID=UPI00237B8A36|nr:NAD-dependent succinate-semialdehyde dehydrogenase [Halocynthiibacter sp. C4]MDE0589092.1 NAD-dependent succinate-semialdehyde dehydrogenase [Halocynthiibacter sp. C4]
MPTLEPKYLIGDTWRMDSDLPPMAVINPATGESLYDVPCCSPDHVAQALEYAEAGFAEWSAIPGWKRAKYLRRIAEEIVKRREEFGRAIATEMGRVHSACAGEADSAAEQFIWMAGEAERLFGKSMTSRFGGELSIVPEPVGIVAAFSPWNFPLGLPARKLAPALAAGCVVILRPSEQTPLVGTILGECCQAAGLPTGVVQVLQGHPDGVSPALMEAEQVRKISFTGSTRVGRLLMEQAAPTVKRVSLELGGHAPLIICPDADIPAAAKLSAKFKFMNTGQICGSPSRFFLHEDIAAEFTEVFLTEAENIRMGDPMSPETTMGPMASPAQLDKLERLVSDAVDKGATLRLGGTRAPDQNKGFFFSPTVLEHVPDDATIMSEEPFGPVASLTTYSDLGNAIARANSTQYGLGSYAFTRSQEVARRLSKELQSGMVGINNFLLSHNEAPFSGVKHSGVGIEGGQLAINEYLTFKTTHIDLEVAAV